MLLGVVEPWPQGFVCFAGGGGAETDDGAGGLQVRFSGPPIGVEFPAFGGKVRRQSAQHILHLRFQPADVFKAGNPLQHAGQAQMCPFRL